MLNSEINFKEIFYSRLNSIKAFSDKKSNEESKGLEQVGIKSLIRKVPALVFNLTEKDSYFTDFSCTDIWIDTDPLINKSIYPHDDLGESLETFLETIDRELSRAASAYILQNKQKEIYLWLDKKPTDLLGNEVKIESLRSRWDNLFYEYNLTKIIGNFGYEPISENSEHIRKSSRILLDEKAIDFIGQEREERYKFDFASKFQMTNSQYLRFRCLIDSANDAWIPIEYKKTAQQVIEFDKF